jgi:hypothetical protein
MFLRSYLEKHEPLGANEKHLSPEARKLIFKGVYFLSKTNRGINRAPNQDVKNFACLYRLIIHRDLDLGPFGVVRHESAVPSYDPEVKYINELSDTAAMARVNRIEKKAGDIKSKLYSAFAVLAIGGLGTFAIMHDLDKQPEPLGTCPAYIREHPSLNTLDGNKLITTKNLGQAVCRRGNIDFTMQRTDP